MRYAEDYMIAALVTIAVAVAVGLIAWAALSPKPTLRNGDYCLVDNGQVNYDHCVRITSADALNIQSGNSK